MEEYPYLVQTRINICVKNMGVANILFSIANKVGHEDLVYNNRVLEEKMKIGFCERGEYCYNRSNETSITHVNFYALNLFEETAKYYEELFKKYEYVPRYFQVMYMNDVSWKLKENILFPYYLKGIEYEQALARLKALMDRVEDDIILNNPTTDNFHRHFFMNWKKDSKNIMVVCEPDKVSVVKESMLILKQEQFEIILCKLNIRKDMLTMLAFVKSSLFNYLEKPNVYVNIEKNNAENESFLQNLSLAGDSYYLTKEKTNYFWQFYFECSVEENLSFNVEVEVDGMRYQTKYWCAPSSPFFNNQSKKSIYSGHIVDFDGRKFYVSKQKKEKIYEFRELATQNCKGGQEICALRRESDILCKQKKTIWLYYDCKGVNKDNGWKQFEYDFDIADGIERYYIDTEKDVFESKYDGHIVEFGSLKHKLLYLLADTILTAYIEPENVVPFLKDERAFISDIAHARIIYLQHGILHAHLPWKYVPGRVEADKIVVSSEFEIGNFTNIYHFRKKDIIPTGMARYDFMDRNIASKNRILFAPSWRNYLIGSRKGNEWVYTDEKFLNSSYYRCFNSFLNSPKLESILESNDLYMDFKIHPIFKHYLKYFEHKNNRVQFMEDLIDENSYAIFITDFSSFVFDFGYLRKAIMYFVPDWEEFISGMNQYRELDLPFEKAFGPLVKDENGAIGEIEKIILKKYESEKEYVERMENFYLPLKDCRAELYRYLMDKSMNLEGENYNG